MRTHRRSSAVYKRQKQAALKRGFKRASIYFFILLFLGMGISLIYYCRTIDFFPITNVRLFVNQQYMDTARLKQLVSNKLKGNFFTLSLTPIIQTLLTDDQIKAVSIQRIWPGSLSIYLNGYKPIALFNTDKVVTIDGYTFKTPKHLTPLPQVSLQGPIDQAKAMIQRLQLFNKRLKSLNLTVVKFIFDNELYKVTLSNGLNLTMSDRAFDQRLIRFVQLYSKVIGRCEMNVVSVDLRYSNGLAIKWNDEGKCISQ